MPVSQTTLRAVRKSIKFTYNQGAGTESGIVASLDELTSVVSGYGNGPVDDARYVVSALFYGFFGSLVENRFTRIAVVRLLCAIVRNESFPETERTCLLLVLSRYHTKFSGSVIKIAKALQNASTNSELSQILAHLLQRYKFPLSAEVMVTLKAALPDTAWLVRMLIDSAIAAIDTRSSEDNSSISTQATDDSTWIIRHIDNISFLLVLLLNNVESEAGVQQVVEKNAADLDLAIKLSCLPPRIVKVEEISTTSTFGGIQRKITFSLTTNGISPLSLSYQQLQAAKRGGPPIIDADLVVTWSDGLQSRHSLADGIPARHQPRAALARILEVALRHEDQAIFFKWVSSVRVVYSQVAADINENMTATSATATTFHTLDSLAENIYELLHHLLIQETKVGRVLIESLSQPYQLSDTIMLPSVLPAHCYQRLIADSLNQDPLLLQELAIQCRRCASDTTAVGWTNAELSSLVLFLLGKADSIIHQNSNSNNNNDNDDNNVVLVILCTLTFNLITQRMYGVTELSQFVTNAITIRLVDKALVHRVPHALEVMKMIVTQENHHLWTTHFLTKLKEAIGTDVNMEETYAIVVDWLVSENLSHDGSNGSVAQTDLISMETLLSMLESETLYIHRPAIKLLDLMLQQKSLTSYYSRLYEAISQILKMYSPNDVVYADAVQVLLSMTLRLKAADIKTHFKPRGQHHSEPQQEQPLSNATELSMYALSCHQKPYSLLPHLLLFWTALGFTEVVDHTISTLFHKALSYLRASRAILKATDSGDVASDDDSLRINPAVLGHHLEALIDGFTSVPKYRFIRQCFNANLPILLELVTHNDQSIKRQAVKALCVLLQIDPSTHDKISSVLLLNQVVPIVQKSTTTAGIDSTLSDEGEDDEGIITSYLCKSMRAHRKSHVTAVNFTSNDFARASKALVDITKKSLHYMLPSESNITANFVNGKQSQQDEVEMGIEKEQKHIKILVPSKQPALIEIESMRHNLSKVMDTVQDPVPLLLEGATGIGKSAIVIEAARRLGKPLVRFNMSSSVSIASLFGSPTLRRNQDNELEMKFKLGPFASAFRSGYWLLLDEWNLTPELVLQSIEQALDSGTLRIMTGTSEELDNANFSGISMPNSNAEDGASSKNVYAEYRMHPEFRLFATQNPSTGLFKAAREPQTASLLSRFTPVVLQPPTDDELYVLLEGYLNNGAEGAFSSAEATKLSRLIVSTHLRVTVGIKSTKECVKAQGYAEITLRNTLQWADSVLSYHKEHRNRGPNISSNPRLLLEMAWIIYGARFRKRETQDMVIMLLQESLQVSDYDPRTAVCLLGCTFITSSPPRMVLTFSEEDAGEFSMTSVEDIVKHWCMFMPPHSEQLLDPSSNMRLLLGFMVKAHNAVIRRLMRNIERITSSDPVSVYLYGMDSLWRSAASIFEKPETASKEKASQYMIEVYTKLVREIPLKQEIRQIIINVLGRPLYDAMPESLLPRSSDGRPYVVYPEVIRVWKHILHCMRMEHPQPVLLVGPAGFGKSECVRALAAMLNRPCLHLHITPQTQPAALVGQYVPGKDKTIRWEDGVVTKAVREGMILVLENLSEAPPGVLERLNPLLEQIPNWTLTENNEIKPLPIGDGFRVIATMTPTMGKLQETSITTSTELTPALANRFCIISMTSGHDTATLTEMFLSCFGADPEERPPQCRSAAEGVVSIYRTLQLSAQDTTTIRQLRINPLTVRSLVRATDGLFKLLYSTIDIQFATGFSGNRILNLTFEQTLHLSLDLVFLGPYKRSPKVLRTLKTKIQSLLEALQVNLDQPTVDLMAAALASLSTGDDEGDATHKKHVLDPIKTPSRYASAKVLISGILCGYPQLLEGPAATGKTSLVEYMAKLFGRNCERVNNSQSTSVQDYMGSYMPDGTFADGPLTRAMKNGDFFVSDEFDLAEPAVMNLLYPLLEGQCQLVIPNTNVVVHAIEGFRFFATQNGTGYAGRKELPLTLRSRFTEVYFVEFTEQEISFILENRKFDITAFTDSMDRPPTTMKPDEHRQWIVNDIKDTVHKLARVYMNINNAIATDNIRPFGGDTQPIRLTMRELVKWINRRAKNPCTPWGVHGMQLLLPRIKKLELVKEVGDMITSQFPDAQMYHDIKCLVEDSNPYLPQLLYVPITLNQKFVMGGIAATEGEESQSLGMMNPHSVALLEMLKKSPDSFRYSLMQLRGTLAAKEPALLIGPTGKKSRLITSYVQLSGCRRVRTVYCTADMETSDLIGYVRPYSIEEALNLLLQNLHQALERTRDPSWIVRLSARVEQKDNLRRWRDQVKNLLALVDKEVGILKAKVKEGKTDSAAVDEDALVYTNTESDQDRASELFTFPTLTVSSQHDTNDKYILDISQLDNDDDFESTYLSDVEKPMIGQAASYLNADDFNFDNDDDLFGDAAEGNDKANSNRSDDDASLFSPVSDLSKGPVASTETTMADHDKADSDRSDDDASLFGPANATPQEIDPKITPTNNDDSELFGDEPLSAVIFMLRNTLFEDELANQAPNFYLPNDKLGEIHNLLQRIALLIGENGKPEAGMAYILVKSCNLHRKLRRALQGRSSNTLFLFQDGPVTQAVKNGDILILEDINEPPQAVIERLNSLFETEPSFSVFEDHTIHDDGDYDDDDENIQDDESDEEMFNITASTMLPISDSFAIIATVHVNSQVSSGKSKLSPAMRSRMTEIYVDGYSKDELKQLCIHLIGGQNAETICTGFTNLASNELEKAMHTGPLHSRHYVRFANFVNKHREFMKPNLAAAHAIRFLFLDELSSISQLEILPRVKQEFDCQGEAEMTALEKLSIDEFFGRNSLKDWAALSEDGAMIKLKHGGFVAPLASHLRNAVAASSIEISDWLHKFKLDLTPTVMENTRRIFASIHTGYRLLLSGAPGIGKTKIVEALGQALGYNVERINMSTNTTIQDLLGSFIPVYVDGEYKFEFKAGILYNALKHRDRTWILFDEINLAPPTLLGQLTPLFAGGLSLSVPGTGEEIRIDGAVLIAAMNPVTIGGGRNKLSRGVMTHFTRVNLEVLDPKEIMLVSKFLLERNIIDGNLTVELVNKINDFHCRVAEESKARIIGKHGGPYEFNLRDIEKINALITGNSSQQLHLQFNANAPIASPSTYDITTDLNEFSMAEGLRIFLELVYARRMVDQEDQSAVVKLINKLIPVISGVVIPESTTDEKISCDLSLKNVVRIGFVYLTKYGHTPLYKPLYHTDQMLRDLQMLAAATQSRMAVLLEGKNCSAKSALVQELARLANQQLVAINIHQDTVTSDLLGSYHLTNSAHTRNLFRDQCAHIMQQLVRLSFTSVLPALLETNVPLFLAELSAVASQWQQYFKDKVSYIVPLESLHTLLRRLLANPDQTNFDNANTMPESLTLSNRILKGELNQLNQVLDSAGQLVERHPKVIRQTKATFEFLPGPLVEAIKKGYWVLLENINMAPGDVIERLNPLAEADSSLSLFEGGQDVVLTRTSGGIHPDFRLFFTANPFRRNTNKISSALRNRCIVLRTFPLDDLPLQKGVESPLDFSKGPLLQVFGGIGGKKARALHEILCVELAGINAGAEMASLLLQLHIEVKSLAVTSEIRFIAGYELSFHNLQRAARIIRHYFLQTFDGPGLSTTPSIYGLIKAVLRSYVDPIIQQDDKNKVLHIAAKIFGDVGSSAGDSTSAHTQAKIKLTKEILQKDLSKILNNIKNYKVGDINSSHDPVAIPDTPLPNLKYTLLAAFTRGMQTELASVLRDAYLYGILRNKLVGEHRFEFVVAVDNSCSMAGTKMREALNGLVMVMEALRRLEFLFGVISFGSKPILLKNLDTPLTNERGQVILESFTCDERTLPVDGLKFIAQAPGLFGKPNVDQTTNHRLIIIITDGIAQQRNPSDYNTWLQIAGAELVFVNIQPPVSAGEYAATHRNVSETIMRQIVVDGQYEFIGSDEIARLPAVLSGLVIKWYGEVLARAQRDGINDASSSQSERLVPFKSYKQTAAFQITNPVEPLTKNAKVNPAHWGSKIYVSHPLAVSPADQYKLPLLAEHAMTDAAHLQLIVNAKDFCDFAYSALLDNPAMINQSDQVFAMEEARLHETISDLTSLFEDVVFINNKATRSLPDTRGSRLSMPGVLRWICTEGQELKIYENMIGYHKKNYCVSLLLDVSVSMDDIHGLGAIDCLLAMCSALEACGISNFSVLTFGTEVRLIKDQSQPWDAASKHMVLSSLQVSKMNDGSSYISDAVFYATDLLADHSGSNSGPMMMFVFTDGYDQRGMRLAQILKRAEEKDILVIGVGIGLNSGGVGEVFQHYVVAQKPNLLPDALRQFFDSQGNGDRPENNSVIEEKTVNYGGVGLSSLDDIWEHVGAEHFTEEVAKARRNIYHAFDIKDRFGADLCFVMDCTGSMGVWIEAGKNQIYGIVQKIKDDIFAATGQNIKLRVSFVAYRDFGDTRHLDSINFTESVGDVRSKIAAQSASGGGDWPDDVAGGLCRALSMSWESEVKFLVLIADAPGHGPWCTGGGRGDNYPSDTANGGRHMADIVREIKARKIRFMFSRIESGTDHMLRNMRTVYDDPPGTADGMAIVQMELSSTNVGELQNLVTKTVTTVIVIDFM